MAEIAFFTAESYETFDKKDKSISAYDMTAMNSIASVNKFLASNPKQKSVASFSELFTPYTTNANVEFMPYMNLTYVRPRQNVVIDDGVSPFTVAPFAGSGDARQEVLAIDVESGINYGIIPTFEGKNQIYDKDDADNINSIAFRTPMLSAGFGYTTEGMPTPNRFQQQSVDDDDYYPPDTATSGYDTYQFADRVKHRPDLWNAGPIDLRWDQYKQMFVAAPEMFIGYALNDIPAASGRWAPSLGNYPSFTSGEIECGMGRYDGYNVPSGTDGGSTHKLLIINRSVTMDIASGSLVVATRLNNGEYFPIFADCAPDTM